MALTSQEFEPNNLFESPNLAILTDENVGSLSSIDDVDVHKFVVSKYSKLTLALDFSDQTKPLHIRFYADKERTKLIYESDLFLSIDDREILLNPGEYYFVIEDSSIDGPGTFNDTDYTLKFTLDEQEEMLNTIFAPEDEPTLKGGVLKDVLLGTSGSDFIEGKAGNDKIIGGDGSDILWGGLGADTMNGGNGNDIYLVDNAKDVVQVDISGTDAIWSSINIKTLRSDIEDVKLLDNATSAVGNANDNWLVGNENKNSLSGLGGNDTLLGGIGKDTLNGGAGNDVMDGGAENDSMVGGAGNDTYVVDDLKDIVVESANAGIDTVIATTSVLALAKNVENLILSYTSEKSEALPDPDKEEDPKVVSIADKGLPVIYGVGNTLDNYIEGNQSYNYLYGMAGDDTIKGGFGSDALDGGTGHDELWGGHGDDTFNFEAAIIEANSDLIMDFESGKDLIVLSTEIFKKLDLGVQADFSDYLIYDDVTGNLSYDADGTGIGAAVTIANITNYDTVSHTLLASDIIVI